MLPTPGNGELANAVANPAGAPLQVAQAPMMVMDSPVEVADGDGPDDGLPPADVRSAPLCDADVLRRFGRPAKQPSILAVAHPA